MGNIIRCLIPRDLFEVIADDDASEYVERWDEFKAKWRSRHDFLAVLRKAKAHKICREFVVGTGKSGFELVDDAMLLFIYDSCYPDEWFEREMKLREPRLRSYLLTKGYVFPVKEESLSDIYYALTVGRGHQYHQRSVSPAHDTAYYSSEMCKLYSLMITPCSVGNLDYLDKGSRMKMEDKLLLYDDTSDDWMFYKYYPRDKQPYFARVPWLVRAIMDGDMGPEYIKCFYTKDRHGRSHHGKDILKLLNRMGIRAIKTEFWLKILDRK